MPVVGETLALPGDGSPTRAVVYVGLAGAGGHWLPYGYGPDDTFISKQKIIPDGTGAWSVDLVPNVDITPADTVYRVQVDRIIERGGVESSLRFIDVPDGAGPYTVQEVETSTPAGIPGGGGGVDGGSP